MNKKNLFYLLLSIGICCVIVSVIIVIIITSLHKSKKRNWVNNYKFFQKERGESNKKPDLKHTVNVLNLDKDMDRMKLFHENWKDKFLNVQRFPAIRIKTPHVGCSSSHVQCVRQYFENNPDKNIAIVMEDDSIPFQGLDSSFINEYIDILEKNADKFHFANLAPINMNKNYNPSGKVTICSFAPNHFISMLNNECNNATHFMVYSKKILPMFNDYINYLNVELPIVIDRISHLSHGPFKLPNMTVLLPDVCFAYQNDGVSNNSGNFSSLTGRSFLSNMHKNIRNLWNARSSPVDNSVILYKNRHENIDKIFYGVTVVSAIFPISSKMSIDHYLNFGKTLLENVTAPMIVFTIPSLKERIQSFRPKGWPLKIITFENGIDDIFPLKNFESSLEKCSSISSKQTGKNITRDLLKVYLSKPYFVDFAIKNTPHEERTKYYFYLDFGSFRKQKVKKIPSGNSIFQDTEKLRFFPSYAKIDMAFNSSKNCQMIFPKKTDYNDSLESLKSMELWNTTGGFIIGTQLGFQTLCNSLQSEINSFLRQHKYPYLFVDECLWELLVRKYPDFFKRIETKSTSDIWFGFYELFQDYFHVNPEKLKLV
jgi:hypothetical protein